MKTFVVAGFMLLATTGWALSDPCRPFDTPFTPAPGENSLIDAQRSVRERECYEYRKRELSDLRTQVEMLKLRQQDVGSVEGRGSPPTPSPLSQLLAPPKKPNAKCLPSRAEVKALASLYAYTLEKDASEKRAEAKGETYYGSNYWEEWHAGTDPARKAVDRLSACGYSFPSAYGSQGG